MMLTPDPDGKSLTSDAHLAEILVASDEVFKGHFLHVRSDTVKLPDGSQATREHVIHPGAVMIIAQFEDGRVVLERQYRHPMHAVMIEFPAGKLDLGEDSLACAQRELREETGYTARQWAKAGVLHPVISYSTEFIDIWFASDLTEGERKLDAGEFLDVFAAAPDQLLAWCGNGQVTDAKTLTGMLWLQNVLSGLWVLDWQSAAP